MSWNDRGVRDVSPNSNDSHECDIPSPFVDLSLFKGDERSFLRERCVHWNANLTSCRICQQPYSMGVCQCTLPGFGLNPNLKHQRFEQTCRKPADPKSRSISSVTDAIPISSHDEVERRTVEERKDSCQQVRKMMGPEERCGYMEECTARGQFWDEYEEDELEQLKREVEKFDNDDDGRSKWEDEDYCTATIDALVDALGDKICGAMELNEERKADEEWDHVSADTDWEREG